MLKTNDFRGFGKKTDAFPSKELATVGKTFAPKTLRGRATAPIEFGQHVLVRGFDCSPADPTVANGIARALPAFMRQKAYAEGDHVLADRIEGVGQRDVHALAAMPIMDPIRINLPAGKLSEEEYQARLDLQFREAGIERE